MAFIDTPETQKANRRFIRTAMKAPVLEADHELALARAWREDGDESALHELTEAYMRLVISMASKFRNYGLPMGDLVQEGNVGLMQAAARFEPEREVRFSTYASWWIRSSMQDYILRNWSIVRTGTTSAQKSLFFNLRRLRAKIDGHGNANMTADQRAEIARTLGVSERDVEHMEGRMSGADRSLNAPVGEDGDAQLQDLLPSEDGDPERRYVEENTHQKQRAWIEKAMGALNPRELLIIRERKLSEDAVTLESLGKRLGISKERVRQIESAALAKLKDALLNDVPDPKDAGLVGT
jgi:RNA polymerase sigma-32 factor